MKKQLIKDIKSGLIISTVIIICLSIFGFAYAAITQVTSGDILTAAKFNSLIDASYHTATAKKNTGDFSLSTATWTTDSVGNTSINVKNNDLIFLVLDGKMLPNNTSAIPQVKPIIIDGPGVFLSDSSPVVYTQGSASNFPFSVSSIIRANGDGLINIGYQGSCVNPGTCLFRGVELKAFTVGKYQ